MICFTIKKSISHWWSRKVNVVKLGRKSYRWILQLNLKYLEKATGIWQNVHLSFDITYLVKSELRIQNLSNIVWPSQNTWTLLTYISTYLFIQRFLFFNEILKNPNVQQKCEGLKKSSFFVCFSHEKYLRSRNIFFFQSVSANISWCIFFSINETENLLNKSCTNCSLPNFLYLSLVRIFQEISAIIIQGYCYDFFNDLSILSRAVGTRVA